MYTHHQPSQPFPVWLGIKLQNNKLSKWILIDCVVDLQFVSCNHQCWPRVMFPVLTLSSLHISHNWLPGQNKNILLMDQLEIFSCGKQENISGYPGLSWWEDELGLVTVTDTGGNKRVFIGAIMVNAKHFFLLNSAVYSGQQQRLAWFLLVFLVASLVLRVYYAYYCPHYFIMMPHYYSLHHNEGH